MVWLLAFIIMWGGQGHGGNGVVLRALDRAGDVLAAGGGGAPVAVADNSQPKGDKVANPPAISNSSIIFSHITFYACVSSDGLARNGDGGYCGHTYSGQQVAEGMAACAPERLGQRFQISGDPTQRTYTCTDTGSAVVGEHVDVFWHYAEDGWRWQAAVGSKAWVIWREEP